MSNIKIEPQHVISNNLTFLQLQTLESPRSPPLSFETANGVQSVA